MPHQSKADRDREFSEFCELFSGSLRGTAWLLTGSPDLSAELVQLALVKTYVAWPGVRAADAQAYARRALINANTDRLRKRLPELRVVEELDHAATTQGQSAVDDRDEVLRMLATLPPQQRTLVVLRYFDDLPEAQIAQEMGISLGAVKSGLSRGLAALRTRFVSPEGILK